MPRYISSYHIERRKKLIIRIASAVGALLIVSIAVWALSGPESDQQPNEPKTEAPAVQDQPKEREVTPIRSETPLPPPAKTEPPAPAPIEIKAKYVDESQPADEQIKIALDLANVKPIEARNILNQLLIQSKLSHQQTELVKQKLATLADYWLFSRKIFPNDPLCETYTVESGDNLTVIAKKYKVPHEIIMQINGIKNDRSLMEGQKIKVIKGPFHAKVTLSTFNVDIFLQTNYVKSFKAGLGKPGRETPTGYWVVKYGGKLVQPDWWDDELKKNFKASDPDYPLGTRWIELHGLDGNAVGREGIAFHGTKDDDSIGTKSSRGCIRLLNKDVELLYSLLEPGESNVLITD